MLSREGGGWKRPPGWNDEAGRKAGRNPNPWYGCMTRDWLDRLMDESDDRSGSVEAWDRGVQALGEISGAAVEGCKSVWREVTKLWQEQARRDNHELSGPGPKIIN